MSYTSVKEMEKGLKKAEKEKGFLGFGDIYSGYEVIQICCNENWGVYLLRKLVELRTPDDGDKFGVLDYSFETDSVYDFDENLDIYTALDIFVGRMPITYGTIEEMFGM